MESFTQRVKIPESRRLYIEVCLPEDVAPGDADVTITVSPVEPPQSFMDLAGVLRDSPIAREDSVAWQRKLRDEWS